MSAPAATSPVAAPGTATPPSTTTAAPVATTPPTATPPTTPPPVATPPPATTPPATAPVANPSPISSPPTPPPASAPPATPPPAAPVVTPPAVPPPAPPPGPAPAGTPPSTAPIAAPPGSSPPPPSPPPPSPSPSPPPPSPPPPPPSSPTPGSPLAPPPPLSPPPPSPVAPPPPSVPPPPAKLTPRAPAPPLHVNGTHAGGGGGISTTAIVGIAVGGVVAVMLVFVVWVCVARKKPKQKLNYAHRVGHAAGAGGVLGGSAASDGLSSYGARTEYLGSGEIKPPPPPPGLSSFGNLGTAGLGLAAGVKKQVPPPPQANSSAGSTRPWFTYEELEEATNGFSPANVLGEGGFGRVYKGVIAGNQLVAVKQLTIGGGQGEREFRAEVEIISRVHHRHLVSLVGYCIADSQRLLVYDFVPNGTLEHALHGPGKPVMDWATRMKIALGGARGLAYLHEDCHPRIIHRDIKASNILLDNHWEAQVSDFGLAKLANDTYTHVTTRVMGTFGYLAPEYALSGKLTDKSDVYSFGVVLLELITGKKPVDVTANPGEESLVEWARPVLTQAIESGNVDGLADPNLMEMYNEKEMLRMVEAAAACVRHSSQKRPKMAMVVRALETEGADLNQGVKPGYSTVYGGFDTVNSSDFDSSQYKANLKKFRQVAYGTSTSQYSSDYSAGASDYGAAQSASSSEFGSSSREHATAVPPTRGPNAVDSASSGERSADDVRLDIGDEPSPRGVGTGLSPRGAQMEVGLSKMGPPVGSLPLPPNRRPLGTGVSVRSPRGESVRSRSPAGMTQHQRRGSESGSGGGTGIINRLGSFGNKLSNHDSTPRPPPPPPLDYGQQYSGEFPDSKYSTEDEGSKRPIKADRQEEGSRPLLSSHKTKTVKFDFDG